MLGRSGVEKCWGRVVCCSRVLSRGVGEEWGRAVLGKSGAEPDSFCYGMVDCYDSCCDFGL